MTTMPTIPIKNVLERLRGFRSKSFAARTVPSPWASKTKGKGTTKSQNQKRRVHFSSSPPRDVAPSSVEDHLEVPKEDRWYSMKQLRQQFLIDLEQQHWDLLHQDQDDFAPALSWVSHHDDTTAVVDASVSSAAASRYTNHFRGLEFHLPQNLHKTQQSARYVRAVVEKSFHLRQHSENVPMFRRRYHHKKRNLHYHNLVSEQLRQYASPLTHMARDHALGVAARDED